MLYLYNYVHFVMYLNIYYFGEVCVPKSEKCSATGMEKIFTASIKLYLNNFVVVFPL